MAQWVSLDMSKLLPSEVETIMDAIEGLLTVVKTPLELVSSALSVAKNFLVGLPVLSFISAVKSLVESFQNDLLGSGFYLCDMWDYPVRQLQPASYGPEESYGTLSLEGGEFEDTFLADLIASFDDTNDFNRPQFTGKTAMFVFVIARGTLDDVGIQSRDGDMAEAWRGMQGAIANAGRTVDDIRWRGAWLKMRLAAEQQSSDKVAVRVSRVQRAFRMFTHMTREELDVLQLPMNPETGESFFEGMDVADLSWENDILPIVEAVETYNEPVEYPDWQRATLKELFPELTEIIDYLFDAVLDLLQDGSTIKDAIVGLMNGIKAKIEELESYIDMIDMILEDLENILKLTGFHGIYLSTDNGVESLKTQLQNSTGYPFSGKGFYAGMALLAGGSANVTTLSTIFAPVAGAS